MNQPPIMIGIYELRELESSSCQDGYDDVRREINHLLATIKAMVVLLPHSERCVRAGSELLR